MGSTFEICGNDRSRVSSSVLTFHGHKRHVWRTRTYQSALFLIVQLHDGYDGHTCEFATKNRHSKVQFATSASETQNLSQAACMCNNSMLHLSSGLFLLMLRVRLAGVSCGV